MTHLRLCLLPFLLLAACASRAAPPVTAEESAPSEVASPSDTAEAAPAEQGAEPSPAPAPADDCVPEGGTAYTLAEQQCCEGLTFLLETGPPYQGECIETPPGPSPGSCVSTCGNGSCDAPENACNCAADCTG